MDVLSIIHCMWMDSILQCIYVCMMLLIIIVPPNGWLLSYGILNILIWSVYLCECNGSHGWSLFVQSDGIEEDDV